MSNGLSNVPNIEKIVEQTAFNLSVVSKQMGLLQTKVEDHEIRLKEIDEKADKVDRGLSDLKLYVNEHEYIEPADVEKIKTAMKNRVRDLLSELQLTQTEFRDYYGKFMNKFWIDCKHDSYAVGKAGVYTKKRNFKDLITYIGQWQPEGYGSATAYIDHLKISRRRLA